MKELRLSLKKKWFDMTAAGIKKEDYREMSPYWMARFMLYGEKPQSKQFWFIHTLLNYKLAEDITFRKFDVNVMTLGYPKSNDSERTLRLEHKGIEIRAGNPEWGADPINYIL